MRRSIFFATLGLVAAGVPYFGNQSPVIGEVPQGAGIRHYRDGKPPRGRGKQAKPRKRSNMKLVSKRVRRKHRRAA